MRDRVVIRLPISVHALAAIRFPDRAVVLTEHDQGPDVMVVEWERQEDEPDA